MNRYASSDKGTQVEERQWSDKESILPVYYLRHFALSTLYCNEDERLALAKHLSESLGLSWGSQRHTDGAVVSVISSGKGIRDKDTASTV